MDASSKTSSTTSSKDFRLLFLLLFHLLPNLSHRRSYHSVVVVDVDYVVDDVDVAAVDKVQGRVKSQSEDARKKKRKDDLGNFRPNYSVVGARRKRRKRRRMKTMKLSY